MKYIDEYRDKKLVSALVDEIRLTSRSPFRIMEVCGGHTVAIRKFGIPALLPPTIRLLSGPGCPVCVTETAYIDQAILIARQPGTLIATYGDLMRVPGSSSSLEKEKANGAEIRMVYSPLDALEIARQHPAEEVVFLGIGFETTSPASAVAILRAKKEKLKNFHFLSAHKVMPPAMEILIDLTVQIDGYICPGHVSTITGSGIYAPIVEKYGLGCVITGFEPADLLQGILMLVRQFESKDPKVEIQYKRAVRPEGNKKALHYLDAVFELKDDRWRGLGLVPGSGFRLKEEYGEFEAESFFDLNVTETRDGKACLCGEILKGLRLPPECTLFGGTCTPENPVGACMVSPEGACQAYFNYGE